MQNKSIYYFNYFMFQVKFLMFFVAMPFIQCLNLVCIIDVLNLFVYDIENNKDCYLINVYLIYIF